MHRAGNKSRRSLGDGLEQWRKWKRRALPSQGDCERRAFSRPLSGNGEGLGAAQTFARLKSNRTRRTAESARRTHITASPGRRSRQLAFGIEETAANGWRGRWKRNRKNIVECGPALTVRRLRKKHLVPGVTLTCKSPATG